MRYGTAGSMVPAVVRPQTDKTAASPSRTTYGEHMLSLDMIPEQSQMRHGTSQPGSSQMRLGSEKPQSHKHIVSLPLVAATDSSQIMQSNPVEPVSF